MPSVLIVGATRGLGASLAKQYAAQGDTKIYGTSRSTSHPADFPSEVKWLSGIDLTSSRVGDEIVLSLNGEQKKLDIIISAGYLATEDFSAEKGPNWDDEQRMYTTSSIAPVFIVHRLSHAGLLQEGSKVVLVSSEAGSISLRHEKEGGGNYAHHASKAALNMAGRLLSLDLKPKGVIISIVHPGFMRTDMTAGVGYDKYWDAGGAVTPAEAANTLIEWMDKLDMSTTGEYWAPRGPRDIGTADVVLGRDLPTPLQLPW
ncbi:oxidoreductase [Mariannaea sp. PMI_226]|nr:oxidoreductase [Mariannaea sp. PMI_226]